LSQIERRSVYYGYVWLEVLAVKFTTENHVVAGDICVDDMLRHEWLSIKRQFPNLETFGFNWINLVL
jgi:hypothetical protein